MGFSFCLPLTLPFRLDVVYPNSFIHLPTERGFLFAVTQTLRRIWLTQSVKVHTNHTTSLIQGDRKVTQPEVWYLVLARNERDEVELVGWACRCDYTEAVFEQRTGHGTWRHLSSGFKIVPPPTCLFFKKKCSLLLLLNTIFKRLNKTPTWCNKMQILLLQTFSTCFGRHAPIIRSIKYWHGSHRYR